MSLQTDLSYSAQVVRQVNSVESDWPWLRWAYPLAVFIGVFGPPALDYIKEWLQ